MAEPMSTRDVAIAFTEMLRNGDHAGAAKTFNHPDIVSIEAMDGPMAHVTGAAAVAEKAKWWEENHTVHEMEVEGPFVNGDQFMVEFDVDVTVKATGERQEMEEIGLYTVRDGKIVEEKFFYEDASSEDDEDEENKEDTGEEQADE